MIPTLTAILMIAQVQTPVSNGENANQIRASIYEIAIGNQFGQVRAPALAEPTGPAPRIPVRRPRPRR